MKIQLVLFLMSQFVRLRQVKQLFSMMDDECLGGATIDEVYHSGKKFRLFRITTRSLCRLARFFYDILLIVHKTYILDSLDENTF